jgi:hypothetical protein
MINLPVLQKFSKENAPIAGNNGAAVANIFGDRQGTALMNRSAAMQKM